MNLYKWSVWCGYKDGFKNPEKYETDNFGEGNEIHFYINLASESELESICKEYFGEYFIGIRFIENLDTGDNKGFKIQ